MPRHYADYPEAFHYWNKVSSYGSYITATATIVFFVGMIYSYYIRREKKRWTIPWGEGATTIGMDAVVAAAIPLL